MCFERPVIDCRNPPAPPAYTVSRTRGARQGTLESREGRTILKSLLSSPGHGIGFREDSTAWSPRRRARSGDGLPRSRLWLTHVRRLGRPRADHGKSERTLRSAARPGTAPDRRPEHRAAGRAGRSAAAGTGDGRADRRRSVRRRRSGRSKTSTPGSAESARQPPRRCALPSGRTTCDRSGGDPPGRRATLGTLARTP